MFLISFTIAFSGFVFRQPCRCGSTREETDKQPPIPPGGRFLGIFGCMIRRGDCGQQRVGARLICLHLIQSDRKRIDKYALSEYAVLEVGAAASDAVASAPDDDFVAPAARPRCSHGRSVRYTSRRRADQGGSASESSCPSAPPAPVPHTPDVSSSSPSASAPAHADACRERRRPALRAARWSCSAATRRSARSSCS